MPIFNTRNPIEYPLGLVEALASMASGAVGQLAGVPAGLLKTVTSGQYGTQEGVQTAQEEANRVQQAMTYRPRTETAVQGMGLLGKAVDAAKIPPIMPELQPLGAMAMQPKQAYVAQGMNLEKALEPVAESIMQKGGLPASLLEGLASGTQSNMISPAEAMRAIQGTKILDESGMPQMVYRGAQGKYDPLTHNMSEASKSSDTGMWFSGSAPVASTYSGRLGHVSPAYLDMKNPLVVDAQGGMWHDIPTKQLETLMNVHVPKATVSSDFIARLAKSRGYDGVHFKNMIDSKIDEFDDPRSIKPSDVFVNFNPKNVYSALSDERLLSKGNVADAQKFAPVSPTGFYSAVEQAAMNLKREKGPGQGLLNEIIKSPDVKKEELQVMGLLDRFGNSKPTTKQELLDYIGQNKVGFEQKTLSSMDDPASIAAKKYRAELDSDPSDVIGAKFEEAFPDESSQYMSYNDMRDMLVEHYVDSGRAEYDALSNASIMGNVPRYKDYAFPGGKNYREILLTMPTGAEKLTPEKVPGRNLWRVGDQTYYSEGDAVRAAAADNRNAGQFKSSHWDEPNVLAHIRAADHTDADGKNMMLVEEIQSDWHQAGRDKGYHNPEKFAAAQKAIDELKAEHKRLGEVKAQASTPQEREAISAQRLAIMEKIRDATIMPSDHVPDAPMKDTWYQMALKKAIKDAVDNGYDRVGLPTGAAQAERYDLSKQVKNVRIDKGRDGSFAVVMTDINGQAHDPVIAKDAKMLESTIGKELTKRVLDDGAKSVDLSGEGLKVGGEGMKKYYDEVYPKFLDKFAKKYGSSVKETKIKAGNKDETVRYIDITPEMKKEFGGKKKGFPLFSMAAPVGAGGLLDQFDQQQA